MQLFDSASLVVVKLYIDVVYLIVWQRDVSLLGKWYDLSLS